MGSKKQMKCCHEQCSMQDWAAPFILHGGVANFRGAPEIAQAAQLSSVALSRGREKEITHE